jgi:hypothetical protein
VRWRAVPGTCCAPSAALARTAPRNAPQSVVPLCFRRASQRVRVCVCWCAERTARVAGGSGGHQLHRGRAPPPHVSPCEMSLSYEIVRRSLSLWLTSKDNAHYVESFYLVMWQPDPDVKSDMVPMYMCLVKPGIVLASVQTVLDATGVDLHIPRTEPFETKTLSYDAVRLERACVPRLRAAHVGPIGEQIQRVVVHVAAEDLFGLVLDPQRNVEKDKRFHDHLPDLAQFSSCYRRDIIQRLTLLYDRSAPLAAAAFRVCLVIAHHAVLPAAGPFSGEGACSRWMFASSTAKAPTTCVRSADTRPAG